MDRLDMAIALLEEARDEKKRLEGYKRDRDKAYKEGKGWYEVATDLEAKYGREPRKSVVNDNLKMARRLLLAEYM